VKELKEININTGLADEMFILVQLITPKTFKYTETNVIGTFETKFLCEQLVVGRNGVTVSKVSKAIPVTGREGP
jgi:hypothetical protein